MIANGQIEVGDVILYKRKKKIMEWEVNAISPEGDYIEIENGDWSERWICRADVLEILISESFDEVTPERAPVIASKFKSYEI